MKRENKSNHGHYRIQSAIVQIYDAFGEAMKTGVPYQPLLNPPPADPACCHQSKNFSL